ncbi:hypothetical protein B0H17DRAFT_935180 [Mycena rosella]|uniref:DUF6699 domain-containing protein n=1 Tax=Mycena rosella TaxID=1033263 RepID=A0AAD7DH24_MYCRO|nr:hypothetical protein B0H17DRAFT_935180 [Mycena rosella]
MDNTPVPPTTDSEQPGQRLELESPLSSTSTQVVSQVDPFQVGPHYGPVLDPLQIHVLGVTLRLNPLLQHPTAPGARPRLEWNLLFPSGQCSRSDDPPLSWWNGRHEPATFPRSTCIHLVSEVLPWVISVAARNLDVGVTCGDLIDYIAHDMNQFVKQAEYERLPRIQREELRRAYRYNRSRADGVPGELLAPAMRRLDWLGRYTTFAGVRENVALGKRICGDALPCTFELVCLPTTHPIQDDGIRDQDGQDDSACATASRSLCEEEKIDRDFETLEERGGEEKEEKQQPLETIVEGHIEETGDGEA